MKMKVLLYSFLSFLSLGLLCGPPAQTKEVRLKWGATSVRSNGYAHGVLVAKAVNQAYPGQITITVVETGGWVEKSEPNAAGLLENSPGNPVSAYAAYHGYLTLRIRKIPIFGCSLSQPSRPLPLSSAKIQGYHH